MASAERFAASATSTASGAAVVATRFTVDPEIDAGVPQAARYSATIMTGTSFLTTRYNADPRRLSRLAEWSDRARPHLGGEPSLERRQPAGVAERALDVDLRHALSPVVAEIGVVERP